MFNGSISTENWSKVTQFLTWGAPSNLDFTWGEPPRSPRVPPTPLLTTALVYHWRYHSRSLLDSHHKELFFNIKQSWEFKDLFIFSSKHNISDDSLLNINITDIKKYKQDDTLTRIENQLIMYKNYYSQVEKYRKEEIEY